MNPVELRNVIRARHQVMKALSAGRCRQGQNHLPKSRSGEWLHFANRLFDNDRQKEWDHAHGQFSPKAANHHSGPTLRNRFTLLPMDAIRSQSKYNKGCI